jgi:hypothetical protein
VRRARADDALVRSLTRAASSPVPELRLAAELSSLAITSGCATAEAPARDGVVDFGPR